MGLAKRLPILFHGLIALAWLGADDSLAATRAELIEVRKIWDQAPYNAFTDLVRFRDRFYCAFREGRGHVGPDGAIRVLASSDGRTWTSVAHMTDPTGELRDAKLSVTSDNRLMLSTAVRRNEPVPARYQSLAWFSDDGKAWSQAYPVADPNRWLWSITWHKGAAYGVAYLGGCRLYKGSADGKKFNVLARMPDEGNESSLVFAKDDTCYCLLRNDSSQARSGLLGIAKPPYTDWTWKNLKDHYDYGRFSGGPKMIQLPDGRLLAAAKLWKPHLRLALFWIDPKDGQIHEFLNLPVGGPDLSSDFSYPGLVWHDGLLWVSYYSGHEGKIAIYVAKVRLLP